MTHIARKRFGQNFLQDHGIISHIIGSIEAQPNEHWVEIGPGQGALTEPLLKLGVKLDVVELDRDLVALLKHKFQHQDHLQIHSADALRFDFSALATGEKLRVIGNLPYNISSPLLFHLMQFTHLIKDMHFMLQKEMVDRMADLPDGADYGRLSVMLQYHCRIESLFNVPPQAFRPVPRVDSAVVRLIPHNPLPYVANDYLFFAELVKQAFSQRRKTLRNCLKQICLPEYFVAAGIDPQWRAEVLSVADFVRLANITRVG